MKPENIEFQRAREEWKKVPVNVEIWGPCWACGKSYCKERNGIEYGCPNPNCGRNNT